MLAVVGIIASDNINISNLRQSPIFLLRNGEQNITIYYYNTYINQSTPNELASDSLNQSSYSPKEIVKDNCISNITAADGIIGEAVLIDDCDVLIVKLKDEETPVRSGTVSLWVKFNDVKLEKPRYLFDAYDEYNKNRISLYLQPDGFLTFSLHDVNYTSVQIREKLTLDNLSDWKYIAVTWEEGGILKLYVNGNLKMTRDISSVSFDSGFKYSALLPF